MRVAPDRWVNMIICIPRGIDRYSQIQEGSNSGDARRREIQRPQKSEAQRAMLMPAVILCRCGGQKSSGERNRVAVSYWGEVWMGKGRGTVLPKPNQRIARHLRELACTDR